MTEPESGLPPAHSPVASKRRRLLVLTLLALVATGVGALGWHAWHRTPAVPLPAVDLGGADPAVAALIASAQAEVRQSPQSATNWGRLAMILAAHDFGEEAQNCFAEAERLDSREPRWPYHQGLWLAKRNPEAAVPKLDRAVQLCGSDAGAPALRLAELLLAQDRSAEAEEHFRRLLLNDATRAPANLGLARLAFARNDWAASRGHLTQAAGSPLTAKASHALLAEINQRLGDIKDAERERRLLDELPDDPDWPDPFVEEVVHYKVGESVRFAQATQLFRQQRLPEAIRLLEETLREYPNSTSSCVLLGQARLHAGDYIGAEVTLKNAIRLSADSSEAHLYLGIALAKQGKFTEAAQAYHRALQWKPDYTFAHYNLGKCMKELGRRKEAQESFQDALRCKPTYGPALVSLGELFAEDGNNKQAVQFLQRALEMTPDDSATRKLLDEVQKRQESTQKP